MRRAFFTASPSSKTFSPAAINATTSRTHGRPFLLHLLSRKRESSSTGTSEAQRHVHAYVRVLQKPPFENSACTHELKCDRPVSSLPDPTQAGCLPSRGRRSPGIFPVLQRLLRTRPLLRRFLRVDLPTQGLRVCVCTYVDTSEDRRSAKTNRI